MATDSLGWRYNCWKIGSVLLFASLGRNFSAVFRQLRAPLAISFDLGLLIAMRWAFFPRHQLSRSFPDGDVVADGGSRVGYVVGPLGVMFTGMKLRLVSWFWAPNPHLSPLIFFFFYLFPCYRYVMTNSPKVGEGSGYELYDSNMGKYIHACAHSNTTFISSHGW